MERLILDIEKLAQLKSVLTNLYKDYEVLETGYTAIKNISEGNFNLHKVFLDGLLAVSPTVRKYERIVDIISDQGKIVSEYKSAYNTFKADNDILRLMTLYTCQRYIITSFQKVGKEFGESLKRDHGQQIKNERCRKATSHRPALCRYP